jgi:hypothetical protein
MAHSLSSQRGVFRAEVKSGISVGILLSSGMIKFSLSCPIELVVDLSVEEALLK